VFSCDLVEFMLCASSRDQIFSTSDIPLSSEALIRSSFNRWNDAAKRTRSFMRNCWAEFYSHKTGWVPVDISEAWKAKQKED